MYFLTTCLKVQVSMDVKRLLIQKVVQREQKVYVQFIISVDVKAT